MTFTEAAIEVLRRAGKPLHFKEIATEAMSAGLLSHVGQTPEATMGSRLLAMARHEQDRRISAIDAGVFGLAEWGLSHATVAVESTQVEEVRDEDEASMRPRERHPALQDEYMVNARRGGDDRRRRADEDEASRRKKKYLRPADVAFQWLREHGQPATIAELAHALRASDKIPEALERDPASFERALQEENRRRTDGRRSPMFQFDAEGRVTALEAPKEVTRERPARPEKPRREEPRREETRPVAFDEQRRNVLRSIRRRIGGLDLPALERVACAFLEASGYRELNMTRRTRDSILYLARRKWGAGELRYAVRILKPGRELGRPDVQDVRRDLAHYSSQLGVLIGTGECSRDAKSESNVPGASPTMLYGGEALSEALADSGLGVTRRLVEWLDYDDEFFVSIGGDASVPMEGDEEESPPQTDEDESADERNRRGRDRRPNRRPRENQSSEGSGEPRVESEESADEAARVEPPKQTELPFAAEPAAREAPPAAAEPGVPAGETVQNDQPVEAPAS